MYKDITKRQNKTHQYYLDHKEQLRDKKRIWWNSDIGKQYTRKRNYSKRYGISIEQYDLLLAQQGGHCAFPECLKTSDSDRRLAVDHDHQTGKIRGLLCGIHNKGIGYFQDNIDELKRAIKYLEQGVLMSRGNQ